MRKLSYFMKKVGVVGLVLLLIYSSVLPIEIVIAEDGAGDLLIMDEEEDLMVDVEEGSSDEEVEPPSNLENEELIVEDNDESNIDDMLADEEEIEEQEGETSQIDEVEEDASESVMPTASVSSTMFSNGDGTADNPYIIETAEQLDAVRNNLTAHYQLGSNIDLSAYSAGEGWNPIGESPFHFSGTFDGRGYVITGLKINRQQDSQGLFERLGSFGEIKNVILEDVDIQARDSVGALLGEQLGASTIENVTVSGSVRGVRSVGGLVGNSSNSNIIKSSVSGTVLGNIAVGGLVGSINLSGVINQSYTNSVVSGDAYVGGLVGSSGNSNLTISDSYSKGTVSGSLFGVGALIGEMYNGKMEQLFTTASAGSSGGLVGAFNGIEDEVIHSYWNTSVYDPIPGGAYVGEPMTEEKLKQQSTFLEWDFTNTWYMYNGQTFPFLQWEDPIKELEVDIDSSTLEIGEMGQISVTATHERDSYNGKENAKYAVTAGEQFVDVSDSGVVTAIEAGKAVITVTLHGEVSTIDVEVVETSKFADGDGSEENPYIIETAEQLNAVREDLGAHYKLENDIDLAAYSSGQGWVPIGINSTGYRFNGTFDGNGHVINNLSIDRNNFVQQNQGLFGVLGEDGVIKDVALKEIKINSNQGSNIGGLVGLNFGEISGASINGTIEGSRYVGGLVGANEGDVSQSYARGHIIGVSRVGGLIGDNYGDVIQSSAEAYVIGDEYIGGLVAVNFSNGNGISQSFAKSTVIGNQDVGGLVGQNQNTIFQSYAESTVEGNQNTGGLIGNQAWSNIKKVSESYSNSTVTGEDNIGGLVGLKHEVSTVESSYWNTSVNNLNFPDNGAGTPLAEEQLKQFSTYINWDFTNVWYVYNDQTFPFLQWENPLEEVEIDIDSSVLEVGATAEVAVTANHQEGSFDGTSTANYEVTEGEQAVEVDQDGVVTAKEIGEAVITVTLHGEVNTIDVTVVEPLFTEGDGTAENPYIITTAEQLDGVRDNLEAYYQLGADIDLSAYLLGESWEPIGRAGTPFIGTFDGNGYEITGLQFDNEFNENSGLFSALKNPGVIKNVTLVDVDIKASRNTVGGLVGVNLGTGEIENSSVTGTVLGVSNVGGLVGINYGVISESFAVTTTSARTFRSGGLVGMNSGEIINSYASGRVSGNDRVGGLVGENVNISEISESYSSSIVTGNNNVGGLVGTKDDSARIEHSYWNTSVYNGDYPDNEIGTPLMEAELKQVSTFSNWNFTNTWYIYNDQTFPFLQWENPIENLEIEIDSSEIEVGKKGRISVNVSHQQGAYDGSQNAEYLVTEGEQIVDVDNNGVVTAKESGHAVITVTLFGEVRTIDVTAVELFTEGEGTADNPYIITTPEQLDGVRKDLEAHYKLDNDIDLTAYLSGESWEPIGDDQLPFEGTFNGEGYEIKGLKIDRMLNVQGLFGGLGNTGVIKNVTLVDVEIEGDSIIGGLVAYTYHSARIENSTVTGTLSGNSNVGGLVGTNYGMISESAAHTTIQLSNINGGGLAGINYGNIIKSYATGEISGKESIGGLVGGYFLGRDISKLSESYSSSIVTGEENVGGLVGLMVNDFAIIEHSYWNMSVYDGDYRDNEIGTPITEAELKQLSTFTNWDFMNTWYIYNDQTFPFFQWENPLETVEVNVDSSTLQIGDSTQITVTAHHEEGPFDGTSNAEYDVTKGNDLISIDENGQVTAIARGNAEITVTLFGNVSTHEIEVLPYQIASIEEFQPITVDNGTEIGQIGLPTTIQVTVSPRDELRDITVQWTDADEDNPYEATRAGTYTFIGTLVDIPDDIENPNHLTAMVEVIVDVPFITDVEVLEIISVENGTRRADLTLPDEVQVTLNNGETAQIGVSWDNGEPLYEELKAGTYTFTGTFELSDGIIGQLTTFVASLINSDFEQPLKVKNPNNISATVEVEVKQPFITDVEQLAAIHVANGTELSDVGLPDQVNVILNNGHDLDVYVDWNDGVPEYEKMIAGVYQFTGTLMLPEEIENLDHQVATVDVVVGEPIITEVGTIEAIHVANGTELSELILPEQVEGTLNNGNKVYLDVTWDKGDPPYNGMKAGTYLFTGMFELPTGVQNPNNKQAEIVVKVDKPFITDVEQLKEILVENGTKLTEIRFPEQVVVTLNNGETRTINVQWDEGGQEYNGLQVGTYRFTGSLEPLSEIENLANVRATVEVKVSQPIITEVEVLEVIQVSNGTELADIGLPQQVEVTLNNGGLANVDVEWNAGVPKYDGKKAGVYQFTGTFNQLGEIENPKFKQVTVEVIVDRPVIVEVIDLGDLAVQRVANGTMRSELELPEKVEVILNNGEVTEVDVTWDDGNPQYDEEKAGTYTFTGTFVLTQTMFNRLSASIASIFSNEWNQLGELQNPDHLTVTIDVEVEAPFVTEVEQLETIQVENGIKRADLDLPDYVEVMLNNGDKMNVHVNWDNGSPEYNEKVAGTYQFIGTLELLDEIQNIHGEFATIDVLVGDPIITTVERFEKMKVANGTKRTKLELPEQVEITLNNGEVVKVDVKWDEGDQKYNEMQAGTYSFIGTLDWSNELQIVNPNNIQAFIEVEVDQPIIIEVEALAPIQVENGTKRSELELPEKIEILLNNGEKVKIDVSWDDGTQEYNEKLAGTYRFIGMLEQLGEIQNPTNKQAQVDVIVESPVIVEVANLEELGISLVIEVENGTKRSELDLPEKVKVVLNNGDTTEIDVKWDDGTPPYDEKKAGIYTFTGTLVLPQQSMFSVLSASIASMFTSDSNPSQEIQNPHQLTVTVDVEVQEPIITEVEYLERIHVENGTERTELPLPESVEVTLNNGDTAELSVIWDESEPKYDSRQEGAYRFTGTFEHLEGLTNSNQLQPFVEVVVGEPHIIEVEKMEVISVENGTMLSDLTLPEHAKVVLNNGGVLDVNVTWHESEPTYDGMKAGTYTFMGILEQIEGLKNPQNMSAIVEVEVNQPFITEINELDDLHVMKGTKRSELELPQLIEVGLNNGRTIELEVTWDDGEPQYDGTRAGSYQFTGTFQQLAEIVNIHNAQAKLTVIVSEKHDPIDQDPHPVDPISNEEQPSIKDQDFVRREHEETRNRSSNENNDILPKTATPYFTLLLLGFFIIAASRALLFWKRKRQTKS